MRSVNHRRMPVDYASFSHPSSSPMTTRAERGGELLVAAERRYGTRRSVKKSNPRLVRSGLVTALVVALLVWSPSRPSAHDIPRDVTVRAFVKPEGRTLRLLVRAPLVAMRDFEFPQRGPGYLDISAAQPMLRDAAMQWIADYVTIYEGDVSLGSAQFRAARVSLPSDLSFGNYDAALAHVTGEPLPDHTELYWEQAMLDVLFEYPILSDQSEFSIEAGLRHLGLKTMTVLRFLPPGGAERVFQYTGDPGLVRLDPRWHQAVWRFVVLGFGHILDGIDHLLFLFCLVIPFRRFWTLVPIVTSFTVAHSITLMASAFGLAPNTLWFPPLIEMLIAFSIVFMALENIFGPKLERRWLIAFGFGLVHGFGFSFVLSETLQFAGSHLLTSLLSFNVGVELGQLFILALTIPVLELLFRKVVSVRLGTIVLSALLAHTGWHWMTDRWSQLVQYQFSWPALDIGLVVIVMRWLMLLLIVVGAVWLLRGVFKRLLERTGSAETAVAKESPAV